VHHLASALQGTRGYSWQRTLPNRSVLQQSVLQQSVLQQSVLQQSVLQQSVLQQSVLQVAFASPSAQHAIQWPMCHAFTRYALHSHVQQPHQ
jgi:hypothetical protein